MSGKEDILKEQIENEVLERNALTTTGALRAHTIAPYECIICGEEYLTAIGYCHCNEGGHSVYAKGVSWTKLKYEIRRLLD